MTVASKRSYDFSQEHKKIIKILVPLLLIVALPFVLLVASQHTEDRQHASPFQNLNSSDGIGITNNPDGTMGPAGWTGNYSNSLIGSQTGVLSFMITDPMQNPPTRVQTNSSYRTRLSPLSNSNISPVLSNTQTNQIPSGGPVALSSLPVTVSKVEVHLDKLPTALPPSPPPGCFYKPPVCTIACPITNPNCCPRVLICPTGVPPVSGKPSISPMPEQNGVWETLNIKTPSTIDLVELSKGSFAFLGSTKLAAGTYTEVRLYISNASAVLTSGQSVTLDLPGRNNIVRVVKPFNITAGANTTLTMDFDAQNSVINEGGLYILKPIVVQLIVSQGAEPSVTSSITPPISPIPSCYPRPACLDSVPRCLIPEPADGWCAPTPTPISCGGFVQNPTVCPTGYSCDHTGINPDLPGKCVTVSPSPTPTVSCLPEPSCLTANPPTCELPQPPGGWCTPTGTPLSGSQISRVMVYLNNVLRSLLRTK